MTIDVPDDEFLDYIKKQTGSDSFCAAKWYNATIWLGSGMTTSCHHPLPHKIDIDAIKENPSALHNTPVKKIERQMMQAGKRPPGCDYCWRVEDMGKDNISDRVYKTKIYTDEEIQYAATADPQEDINLRTLEIAFNRTCNFACSYCNPAFSTTWAKDIKQNGPYTDLLTDGRNHFTHEHESAQLYGHNETNPYVEAFFKWWETDLHKTLDELRITGGEVLVTDEIWRLFEWYEKNETTTRLAINTNLGVKQELIHRLMTASEKIKHFHLYTSCEATGMQAEYIRDGLDYEAWLNNIENMMVFGNVEKLHIMSTINALCLESLPDFLSQVMEFKRMYHNRVSFTLNILRFPSFQSVLVLPLALRKHFQKQLVDWLSTWHGSLSEMEVNHVKRLIDYLDEMVDVNEQVQLQNDFKSFYYQYDVRRNKPVYKRQMWDTFKIMSEFIDQIPKR